jgi:predicted ATPase
LRIDGEYAYRVTPLEVPSPLHDEPANIRNSSAVQLFVEKTKTLDSQFSPRDDSMTTIAAICRQLDGIPLAIEFAASRAATIGLRQVAARLADRFGLLIQGRRTALPRHQTLRAALDWSYDLLSEPERHLLRQLAVFPAGFTLDAVASVVGGIASPEPAAIDGVGSLVAKSLVTVDGAPSTGRWRLLETIRAYALEKLEESGERQNAARRHAEFVRKRIASAELGSRMQIGNAEMAELAGEIDNVRSALDWAFSPDGDARIAAALTAAYVTVWLHLGSLIECRNRVELVLEGTAAELELSDALRMHLHLGLGIALFFTIGPAERTKLVLRQALEAATRLDDVIGQLRTLWVLWGLHLNIGECNAALSAAEQFSTVARRSRDPTFILYGDRLMGNALCYSGDQAKAREWLQRVLETPAAPTDRLDSIMLVHDLRLAVRVMLARVLWLQGFSHQARDMALACLKEAQAAGHGFSIYETLRIAVCPISLATGELAAAERYVAMMIDLATSSNVSFWIFAGRCLQAKLLVRRGESETGAAQVRLALQACDDSGWTICYPEYQGALAEALSVMGQSTEALTVVEDALARAEHSGERWFVSELLRMKGELLFRNSGPTAAESAEKYFAEAIQVARQQGALCWELRGGLSLARLKLAQGQPELARRALLPIYQRFTEGLDTADLRAARTVLDSLPPPRASAE